jgi:hypothetical protein
LDKHFSLKGKFSNTDIKSGGRGNRVDRLRLDLSTIGGAVQVQTRRLFTAFYVTMPAILLLPYICWIWPDFHHLMHYW